MTIPSDVQLAYGVLVVVSSLDITLADDGIVKHSSPAVVSISDRGVIELQLFLNVTA